VARTGRGQLGRCAGIVGMLDTCACWCIRAAVCAHKYIEVYIGVRACLMCWVFH
jgi:hypothetical protein